LILFKTFIHILISKNFVGPIAQPGQSDRLITGRPGVQIPLGPVCIRAQILDYLPYCTRKKGGPIHNAHQTFNNHKED
jgi:hypothetical protein